MANFYDNWLEFWDDSQAEKRSSRAVIHEDELEWLETPQDNRVALLASPETGFRTWGSESMIAEITPGWHTGKHEHGEEGIYILEGEGFSVVNERFPLPLVFPQRRQQVAPIQRSAFVTWDATLKE